MEGILIIFVLVDVDLGFAAFGLLCFVVLVFFKFLDLEEEDLLSEDDLFGLSMLAFFGIDFDYAWGLWLFHTLLRTKKKRNTTR